MSNQDIYEALIDGLCERIGSDISTMRHMRLDLTVNETPFSLVPSAGLQGEVDAIAFFAEVGTLPERGRAEAAISLLESNLYFFGPETPRYCCNSEKPGLVVMAGRLPLIGTEPETVLRALSVLADAAKETRDSFSALPAGMGMRPSGAAAALLRT